MRIFVGKAFRKWAGSEKLADEDLCRAAMEAFDGQVEADLGGYLFKKRIARAGGGKSGGFRTIIGFRRTNSDRIFFLYGFPKSSRANISRRERDALSVVASSLIDASDTQIAALTAKGTIAELECET